MPKILIDNLELDAAEGPFGIKIWPPEALEPILKAYRRRTFQDGQGWLNWAGEHPPHEKASHHRDRPKGGGLKQFQANVNQKGNGGKR